MKWLVPFGAALVLAACDNGGSPSVVPTAPTVLTTETFTGTVDVGGSDFHTFNAATGGEVDITLAAAGPPTTIFMGLGIGQPSGSPPTCVLFTATGATVYTPAGSIPQIVGTISAGTFCVQVYDIGNQLAQISYTVTVAHP